MTNAEKLAQARNALHLLMIGRRQVSVRYDETSVTYNQANIAELKLYIAELEAATGTPARRGGPFGVSWNG